MKIKSKSIMDIPSLIYALAQNQQIMDYLTDDVDSNNKAVNDYINKEFNKCNDKRDILMKELKKYFRGIK